MSQKPKYQVVRNFDPIVCGDTLDGFAFYLYGNNGDVEVPTKLCSQVRGSNNKLVHDFYTSIAVDGLCTIYGLSGDETAVIPPATYNYDVKLTLSSGRTRAYIKGTLSLAEDITRCV